MIRFAWILLLARQAFAHTGFSNLLVNGVDQGDSVGIRMNKNPALFNFPVNHFETNDFACGYNGTQGVGRVNPIPDGATLTMRWRENAIVADGGIMDPSHSGPCAVC
jgi:Auxiliary Activity family 9 (formerly GH61)